MNIYQAINIYMLSIGGFPLFVLGHVEVLRGLQGMLFGHKTTDDLGNTFSGNRMLIGYNERSTESYGSSVVVFEQVLPILNQRSMSESL